MGQVVMLFTKNREQLIDRINSLHYDAIELLDKGDVDGHKAKIEHIAELSKMIRQYEPIA
ncbi:hypothetical protein BHU72_11850 [Desulfuribacillus stibiiarsenatis]|uniref:Uncharacterized protein n=1 Tax=Desulfuribacillus stibiiarsenatis TaxID=1390249 RepID=A0A1E5L7T4_9FIRM|nr:hypothetical protein [Desulfuribacillus stibiiarsenatis]OEH86222.1 hypothetical protein BHU72_11850 [Desulfuribacillus stibiiarsenatis]